MGITASGAEGHLATRISGTRNLTRTSDETEKQCVPCGLTAGMCLLSGNARRGRKAGIASAVDLNGLRNMAKGKELKVIDLFSGAGGLSVGFREAGFKSIFAVEREEDFAQTYAANFGDHIDSRSIEEVVEDPKVKKLRADVVIGGPPCQGFSNLGPNRADDPRRTMWSYYMDIVESSKCKVFLMENVPNLLTSVEGDAIRNKAIEMGFWVASGVLLASHFGVPQNRRRAFIFGSKLGMIGLPEGNGKRMTVREAFKGIPARPTVTDFQTNGPVPTTALHIARNPTELSRKRYAVIPPGGNRFDLQRLAPELTPDCWIRKTKGGTDLFGRLHWDEPARCTIRTEFYKPEKGRFLHPEENRPITHWEAARLQTFPDDFLWCGTKIRIAIQIGNAVPPKACGGTCSAHQVAHRVKHEASEASDNPREETGHQLAIHLVNLLLQGLAKEPASDFAWIFVFKLSKFLQLRRLLRPEFHHDHVMKRLGVSPCARLALVVELAVLANRVLGVVANCAEELEVGPVICSAKRNGASVIQETGDTVL